LRIKGLSIGHSALNEKDAWAGTDWVGGVVLSAFIPLSF
jgi:hypothetical protein